MKNISNHRFTLRNQKGIALVMVLVLSAIGLGLMTTLIYMITSGVQVSGMQKRYKTALEAGLGGKDIVLQIVAMKDRPPSERINFITALNSLTPPLNAVIPPQDACTDNSVSTFPGFHTKLITSRTEWIGCNASLTINPADLTTYDMRFELGTNPRYNVYAKIVDTVSGSVVGESTKLRGSGVVAGTEGVIQVAGVPNLYTIEMLTENSANRQERAKLQVLYQY